MPYPATLRPPAPNGPGTCPRCLRPIIWATTVNQRAQAVDPARDPQGNQAVRVDGTGRYLVRQLTRERAIPEHDEHLHMPHVATCPAPATPRPQRPVAPRQRRGVRPNPGWRR